MHSPACQTPSSFRPPVGSSFPLPVDRPLPHARRATHTDCPSLALPPCDLLQLTPTVVVCRTAQVKRASENVGSRTNIVSSHAAVSFISCHWPRRRLPRFARNDMSGKCRGYGAEPLRSDISWQLAARPHGLKPILQSAAHCLRPAVLRLAPCVLWGWSVRQRPHPRWISRGLLDQGQSLP